jgi:hypothetical protein
MRIYFSVRHPKENDLTEDENTIGSLQISDSNSFSEDVSKFLADETCLICDVESDSIFEAINHLLKNHLNLIVEESIKNLHHIS